MHIDHLDMDISPRVCQRVPPVQRCIPYKVNIDTYSITSLHVYNNSKRLRLCLKKKMSCHADRLISCANLLHTAD